MLVYQMETTAWQDQGMTDDREEDPNFSLRIAAIAVVVLGAMWTGGSWILNGYPDLPSLLVLAVGCGLAAWVSVASRIAQVRAEPTPPPMDDAL